MYDEDQPTRRLNARRSEPDGDTPEANELARWLRIRVGGRSLRQLESLFRSLSGPVPGPGRTQWNELLNGRKLIHPALLDEVVKKLVPPREQRIHRDHGRALLRAAQDAARLTAGQPDAGPGIGRDDETRLTDALRRRRRVQDAEQGIDGLIEAFLAVTTRLSQQYRELKDEHDRALLRLQEVETTANEQRAAENRKRAAEDQRLVDSVVERLAEIEQQQAEFKERLNSAFQKKREAEDLRAEAFGQLTGRDASQDPAGEDPGSLPTPQPPQYKLFLEIADAELEIYTAELDAAREEIAGPPQGARIIPGQVVSAPSADGTDTTTPADSDGGPARDPSADRPDNESTDRAGDPAAAPRNTGRPGRDDGPTAGRAAFRAARKRSGPRRARIGVVCLALLAGGGGIVWNHYRSAPLKAEYTLKDSPTLTTDAKNRAKEGARPEIVIGVKRDQPGMGEIDADGTDHPRGFEVDLANFILNEIGFKGKRTFREVASENRETGLMNHEYDMILATYSINEERKEKVSFSVPYYRTGQALLMRKGNEEGKVSVFDEEYGGWRSKRIVSISGLPNGTDSCTVNSTSLESMTRAEHKKKFEIVDTMSSYGECIQGLLDEKYEVVSTDAVILEGLAKEHREDLVVPQFTFSTELYGVGMRQGDRALKFLTCQAIKKALDKKVWKRLYDEHLREIMEGEEAIPPDEPECQKLSRNYKQNARK